MLASGRRTNGERVLAFIAPGDGGVAFVAGRRLGGAVQRNRARRILRAAWLHATEGRKRDCDVVLVARSTIVGIGSAQLTGELRAVFERAGVVGR